MAVLLAVSLRPGMLAIPHPQFDIRPGIAPNLDSFLAHLPAGTPLGARINERPDAVRQIRSRGRGAACSAAAWLSTTRSGGWRR